MEQFWQAKILPCITLSKKEVAGSNPTEIVLGLHTTVKNMYI